jgi:predicted GNAT family acetyltransferase
MLGTGQYFGLVSNGRLAAISGIHVFSPIYRVAALGNIATHPDDRGKGFGTGVTRRLCLELLKQVEHVGLNVKADNVAAISCYEKLGFEIHCTYEEAMIRLKTETPA